MNVLLLAHNEMLRYLLYRQTQLYTANALEKYEMIRASLNLQSSWREKTSKYCSTKG